jgi:hypothetical protein
VIDPAASGAPAMIPENPTVAGEETRLGFLITFDTILLPTILRVGSIQEVNLLY